MGIRDSRLRDFQLLNRPLYFRRLCAIHRQSCMGPPAGKQRPPQDDNHPVVRKWGQFNYFSRATTNSGAHSRARLISESGKKQMDLRADSAYSAAREVAASKDP